MAITSIHFARFERYFSHTGPVWQIAWAHPKFGHILASCSYDGKVLIWKEQPGQGPSTGGWTKINEHTLHSASGEFGMIAEPAAVLTWRHVVNSVCWAPHELGPILACASSDGKLSVLTFKSALQPLQSPVESRPLIRYR